MTNTRTRIGIDFRDDLFYVARVDHGAGRPEVKALLRLERQHLSEHNLLKDGRVIISIPDGSAVLRKIRLETQGDDFEARARFELAQSVLEDEKEFYFDILPSTQKYHIGLILRKQKLAQLLDTLLADKREAFPDPACKTRGAALADGYINFCHTGSGNLVCLADFLKSSVSIALIYDNRLLDLMHLSLDRYDLENEDHLKRLAVEFKTALNYKLSSVFAEGITTPLAVLLVSGDAATSNLMDVLKNHFSIEITRPRLNTGFLTGQTDLSEIPLEKYLVALGLAAN